MISRYLQGANLIRAPCCQLISAANCSLDRNLCLPSGREPVSEIYKISFGSSSLDRNRTCIWSFGNSYTIHCTTRPGKGEKLKVKSPKNFNLYFINPPTLLVNIFTAMASKTTPKNLRTAVNPAGPNKRAICLSDFKTAYTITRLMSMPNSSGTLS